MENHTQPLSEELGKPYESSGNSCNVLSESNLTVQDENKKVEDPNEAGKVEKVPVDEMELGLLKIDDIYDKYGKVRTFAPYDPSRGRVVKDEELDCGPYDEWALVLRRVFNHTGTSWKTKIDVQSLLLLDILKRTVKEEKANLEIKKSLKWPNENIFQHRDKIREIAEADGELSTRHARILLDLINEEYATRIRDINNMFPKGTSTFNILRDAFREGVIIVKPERDNVQAYRVLTADYSNSLDGSILGINAEYVDCNGESFGTRAAFFNIAEFAGIQYMNELPVFPLKYHPKYEEVAQRLMTRGRKFASLKGQHFKCYKDSQRKNSSGESIISRVMIDTVAINRLSCMSRISVNSISDELVDGKLTDEHLMICTNKIPFFSLKSKAFDTGLVDNIEDIVFNRDVFDQIVIPAVAKELIHVMIKAHVNGLEFDDFTHGKGKGLIMLLHGPPGVGKTMTAEAVAEHTQRPLYSLTSGELGSSPELVEQKLKEALDIAETFGAVLLLDEADVFMEGRTAHDIAHNALVAVFLRLLEYHQGIIILTTNRVTTIDEAFHSRIHLSLHYSNLSCDAREQIWRNFGALVAGTELTDQDYKDIAEVDVNGRRIKNVFSLCKAIASEKGTKITREHVMEVLQFMKSQLP